MFHKRYRLREACLRNTTRRFSFLYHGENIKEQMQLHGKRRFGAYFSGVLLGVPRFPARAYNPFLQTESISVRGLLARYS